MYNEKRKIEYSNYCRSNGDTRDERFFINVFNYCEEFENRFGKDLSDFTKEEIAEMYSDTKRFRTLNILIVKHSQYSRYADWTNPNNEFHFYDRDDLVKFITIEDRNSRIVTREEFMEVVYSMINSMDQLLLMSIFEGIKGKDFQDLLNLKTQDVNLKGGFAIISTRERGIVSLSNELVEIIKKCLDEKVFTNASGVEYAYDKKDYVYSYRGLGEDIRKLKSDDASHKLRVHYKYIVKDSAIKRLSVVDLQESGKIWFVKDQAAQERMTPLEFVELPSTVSKLRNQFGMNFYRKSLFLNKYRDFLK